MANSAYPLGASPTLSVAFTTDDIAVDPAAVTVTIGDQNGTPTLYTYGVDADLVKNGTGLYAIQFTPDAAGTWLARWVGTTGGKSWVEETIFDVVASQHDWATDAYPPIYASLPQLLAALRLDGTEDIDEVELLRCLQAASRAIDGEVSRRSGGTVTRFYDSADWPAVPAPITEACVLLAVALYKRPQAPFGVLQSQLDAAPIQLGRDLHVDALIDSVVPTSWMVV